MAKATRGGSVGQKSGKKSTPKGTSSKNIKPDTRRTYLSKLCNDLEKAAAGLFHVSESDFPYAFFTLRQRDLLNGSDKLTALEFISGIGLSEEVIDEYKIPVDQLIEERVFDDFFPTPDELAGYHGTDTNDPQVAAESKRYRKLEALLRKRLNDVKVFRVGKIEVRCYIAGFDKHGNIAGLVTTAIET